MANIQEFTHPVVGLQPTDIAASTAREAGTVENRFAREAGAELGTAIAKVGGQVGATVDRHMAAQAISHGSSTYSSLYADLTSQWNQLASKSDPNDTSIAQGFKEQVLDPSIDKFQQAFEGAPAAAQEWALSRSTELRQHFGQRISADMSTRAGLAVDKNLGDMERNYSQTVANDPSALSHIADSVRSDVNALLGQHDVTATDAAKVRNEVVPKMLQKVAASAFDGMAQRDPGAALKALDHGDFNDYADAVTQNQWRRYAETQQKLQDHDAKQDALAAKQKLAEDSAALKEDYRSKMYNHLTGEVLPVQPRLNQEIWNQVRDGKMLQKDATELVNFNYVQYKRQLEEQKRAAEGPPTKDDPQVLQDLRDRVGSTTNPTTMQEVVDATSADKLTSKSSHDLAWRVGQADKAWGAINRPFQQQFMNFKHVMMTSMTSVVRFMPAEDQIAKFNQVEADAQKILREAYARREDMRPYLDPNSPKWALREAMTSMVQDPTATLQQQANTVRAGQDAPETGEVRNGYRYTGPSKDRSAAGVASNWKKVEPSKADLIPQ